MLPALIAPNPRTTNKDSLKVKGSKRPPGNLASVRGIVFTPGLKQSQA
jgi:hypothetical protein